ncbi:MAG: nucleotidyltransferase family protein [Proteobacteria bacterium]|nr:nucleotidyltransferase family protein [Pseudomonadota bacterium]
MAEHEDGEREFTLLCLAMQPRPDSESIKSLLGDGLDEALLLDLAEKHGVRPSLTRCLAALSWQGVGEAARGSLESFRRHHVLRALAMAGELRHVAKLFAESRIAFAAFKGPALALSLYGGLAEREYGDIDIVVPEDRVSDAERLLATLGYRLPGEDPAYHHAFLGYQRQYELVRDDGQSAIDLHWGFSGTHVPFPLTPAEIWGDLQILPIADFGIPTLRGANQALLLAGHGTKERWGCLKWVGDFAWLVDRRRDLDWAAIHARAAAHGCGDAVLLGGAIVRDVLKVPPPAALETAIAASTRVRALGELLVRRLRLGPWQARDPENFTDFDLCERPLDKLRATLKIVFTPTGSDHAALPLPRSLWRAYYLTRPFRLAARLLAGARP